jgi:hypothetical protein
MIARLLQPERITMNPMEQLGVDSVLPDTHPDICAEPLLPDASSASPPASSTELLIQTIRLDLPLEVRTLPKFERPLEVQVREAVLLKKPPWVRSLGALEMEVRTFGYKLPAPPDLAPASAKTRPCRPDAEPSAAPSVLSAFLPAEKREQLRLRPSSDTVVFKERLLYLLQPPLHNLFGNKQVTLPFKPYPYQLQGIAFLMPRHAALIADEMGLGKTAQVIIALRLLFHAGLIHKALVVCPKPLVINWTRELKLWAEDIPFEVIAGDTRTRKFQWFASSWGMMHFISRRGARDSS